MIRRREDNRGPWYLLTGVLLGLALGLVISWGISPVKYVDTAPFSLRADYKDQYRGLIAAAYQADGDLGRARSRLALLQDADPLRALATQAQDSAAGSGSADASRSLAILAAALGDTARGTPAGAVPTVTPTSTERPRITPSGSPTAVPPTPTVKPGLTLAATATEGGASGTGATSSQPAASPSPTGAAASQTTGTPPGRPTGTADRRPTDTPVPTRAPTATPGPPFVVADQKKVCDPAAAVPLLQIQVNDGAGKPAPGVQAIVTWNGGQDSFFTGLKPEISPGYADFVMTAGTVYTLRLADGGEPVNNLTAPACASASQVGGWLITFKQP